MPARHGPCQWQPRALTDGICSWSVDLVRSLVGRVRNHHPASHRGPDATCVRKVLPWSRVVLGPEGWRIRQPGLRLSFLAVYGPLSVVLLLVLWAVLMIVAFTLIYRWAGAAICGWLPDRLALARSSIFLL